MRLIRTTLLALSAMACIANSGPKNSEPTNSGSENSESSDSAKHGPSEEEWQQTRTALSDHIRILASDAYEGRKPGTEGGRKTQQYLIDTLKKYGFEPGASDGASDGQWRQNVELLKSTPKNAKVVVTNGDDRIELAGNGTSHSAVLIDGPASKLDNRELVYVDLKKGGLKPDELEGKIAVIGAWQIMNSSTQNLQKASPDGTIILASNFIQHMFLASRLKYDHVRLRGDGVDPDFQSWALISPDSGERLLRIWGAGGGKNFETPNPGPLPGRVSLEAIPSEGIIESANIIGKLPGRKPGSGAVMMLAHWDHLGICKPESDEDKICNGAVDNASGIGAILEVARKIAADGGLDRDLYVMGVTAEEMGLLGTKAFAQNPPFPLSYLVAAFNVDAIAIAPRGSPVTVIGWGLTGLDDDIAEVIKHSGGKLELEDRDQEMVKRSDHWALLERGAPSVSVESSTADFDGWKKYERGPYHGPGDEWSEELELGGATDDIFLHVELLRHFGNLSTYPVKKEMPTNPAGKK